MLAQMREEFPHFRIEWEAYSETLRASYELKGDAAVRSRSLREHIVSQFTGPGYGWMWPFRRQVEHWYDAVLRDIVCDEQT